MAISPGSDRTTILTPDSRSWGGFYSRRVAFVAAGFASPADQEIVPFSAISAPIASKLRLRTRREQTNETSNEGSQHAARTACLGGPLASLGSMGRHRVGAVQQSSTDPWRVVHTTSSSAREGWECGKPSHVRFGAWSHATRGPGTLEN